MAGSVSSRLCSVPEHGRMHQQWLWHYLDSDWSLQHRMFCDRPVEAFRHIYTYVCVNVLLVLRDKYNTYVWAYKTFFVLDICRPKVGGVLLKPS